MRFLQCQGCLWIAPIRLTNRSRLLSSSSIESVVYITEVRDTMNNAVLKQLVQVLVQLTVLVEEHCG